MITLEQYVESASMIASTGIVITLCWCVISSIWYVRKYPWVTNHKQRTNSGGFLDNTYDNPQPGSVIGPDPLRYPRKFFLYMVNPWCTGRYLYLSPGNRRVFYVSHKNVSEHVTSYIFMTAIIYMMMVMPLLFLVFLILQFHYIRVEKRNLATDAQNRLMGVGKEPSCLMDEKWDELDEK